MGRIHFSFVSRLLIDRYRELLVWQADAEEHGASFAFNTSMIGGAISNQNIEIYAGSTADLTAGLLPLSMQT
jgi:hypothetical protein